MVFIRVGSRNLPRRSYRSQIVLVLDSSGCGSSFPPESWELLLQTSPTISLCSGGAGEVRNTFICERKSSNIVGIVGITSLFDFFVKIIIKRYCRPLAFFVTTINNGHNKKSPTITCRHQKTSRPWFLVYQENRNLSPLFLSAIPFPDGQASAWA